MLDLTGSIAVYGLSASTASQHTICSCWYTAASIALAFGGFGGLVGWRCGCDVGAHGSTWVHWLVIGTATPFWFSVYEVNDFYWMILPSEPLKAVKMENGSGSRHRIPYPVFKFLKFKLHDLFFLFLYKFSWNSLLALIYYYSYTNNNIIDSNNIIWISIQLNKGYLFFSFVSNFSDYFKRKVTLDVHR